MKLVFESMNDTPIEESPPLDSVHSKNRLYNYAFHGCIEMINGINLNDKIIDSYNLLVEKVHRYEPPIEQAILKEVNLMQNFAEQFVNEIMLKCKKNPSYLKQSLSFAMYCMILLDDEKAS